MNKIEEAVETHFVPLTEAHQKLDRDEVKLMIYLKRIMSREFGPTTLKNVNGVEQLHTEADSGGGMAVSRVVLKAMNKYGFKRFLVYGGEFFSAYKEQGEFVVRLDEDDGEIWLSFGHWGEPSFSLG